MSNLIEYKLRNVFPIREYLNSNFPDGRINSTGQFNATCCQCNKKDKFYYNITTFRGLCQSCYAKKDGAGFKTIAGLIMFVENLEYKQALERLKTSANITNSESMVLGEINKFQNTIDYEIDDTDLFDLAIKVEIPMAIEPDLVAIETYFNSRKRPMAMEILQAFPVFMSKALFLRNRMVFKIETNDSYAWLGYLMGRATDDMPKTLNPKGAVLSYMLGGYNYFKDKFKPLLLNEGLFDMFRSILRHYNAVCSFGKTLSSYQIALLNATKASEIVLCYDGDQAGLKADWNIVRKWAKHITKPLSMMILPYGEDPDSCSKKQFSLAFNERRRLTNG